MDHDKFQHASGLRMSDDDINRLKAVLGDRADVGTLVQKCADLPLAGSHFTVEEESDASGLGVQMQWMTVDETIDEATNSTPGQQALRLGLVPVGKCLVGSGDPYFVDTRDNKLPVMRVPHTAVNSRDELIEDKVERVASSLEQFIDDAVVD